MLFHGFVPRFLVVNVNSFFQRSFISFVPFCKSGNGGIACRRLPVLVFGKDIGQRRELLQREGLSSDCGGHAQFHDSFCNDFLGYLYFR